MNEIFGIYKKKQNENYDDFGYSAFSLFKQQYGDSVSELRHEGLHIVVASKTQLQKPIQQYGDHITALGGYLLNEPDQKNIEIYNPSDFHGKFLWIHAHKKTQKIYLFNDTLGHFPVYYYEDGIHFCFASDIHFLLHLDIDFKLSEQHIADYFLWGTTLPETTFFEKIRLLPPASKLILEKRTSVRIKQYKTPKSHYKINSAEEAAEALDEVMKKVMRTYYNYYKKISLTLTGGLDTRYIASFVEPEWNVEFLTLANGKIEEENNNEIILAKRIARLLNKEHKTVISDLFPRPSNFDATYFTRRNHMNGETPVVIGVFGSELLKLQAGSLIHPALPFNVIKTFFETDFFYKTYPTPSNHSANENEIPLIPIFSKEFDVKTFLNRTNLFKKELKRSAKKHSFATITDIITRSYYSNFYGGHLSGNFNHYDLFSRYLTPFIDQFVIDTLAAIPKDFLGTHNNSVYASIFKNKKALVEIPINSTKTKADSNIFNYTTIGQNPLDSFLNTVEIIKPIYSNNIQALQMVFKPTELTALSKQHLWFNTCIFDFSVWHRYICKTIDSKKIN